MANCHDVSAVCGTDLIQIGGGGDVEPGAVGGETGAEAGRRTGRQRTTRRRAADQDRRRLNRPDEILQHRRIRFDPEVFQFGLIVDEHLVDAVFKHLLRLVRDFGSDHQAVDRILHLGRQFAGLSDEFKGDGVNRTLLDFRDHGDSPPEIFVDGGRQIVLHIFKDAVSFFDADSAHAASGVDGEMSVGDFDGFERTECNERLRIRNLVMMNFDMGHGSHLSC